jgi:hypothetical protein
MYERGRWSLDLIASGGALLSLWFLVALMAEGGQLLTHIEINFSLQMNRL